MSTLSSKFLFLFLIRAHNQPCNAGHTFIKLCKQLSNRNTCTRRTSTWHCCIKDNLHRNVLWRAKDSTHACLPQNTAATGAQKQAWPCRPSHACSDCRKCAWNQTHPKDCLKISLTQVIWVYGRLTPVSAKLLAKTVSWATRTYTKVRQPNF